MVESIGYQIKEWGYCQNLIVILKLWVFIIILLWSIFLSTERNEANNLSHLTEQHKMESLSRAYIQTIAGQSGLDLTLAPKSEFDYGVDGTFHFIKLFRGRPVPSGYSIDFQAKATINWRKDDNQIIYSMDVDAYNKIADRAMENRATPMILLLFCMPRNSNDWIEQDSEQLSIRNCCYWYRVPGELSSNGGRIAVRVPSSQILTPTVILDLLRRVRDGNWHE